MPLTTNQKKKFIVLKCCLFLLYATTNHLLIMTCNEQWTAYDSRQYLVHWLDREVPKHFPKPNLQQKRSWVTIWWSAADMIHDSFLNPSKVISSEKYAHKSMRCTENCRPASDQQRGPNSPWQCPTTHHTTRTSKVERIGLQGFASTAIFIWPFAKQLLLIQASPQLFAEEMFPQPAWGRKCFPKVCQILIMDFYAIGINKLIPHWQKCTDCNCFYLDSERCVWA